MLGLGTGKGGQSAAQPMGGTGGLSSLFGNSGGMAAPASAPMAPIMAPQRPNIAMPMGRPMMQPQQQAPARRSIQEIFRDGIIKQQSMNGLERHLARRADGR